MEGTDVAIVKYAYALNDPDGLLHAQLRVLGSMITFARCTNVDVDGLLPLSKRTQDGPPTCLICIARISR
jgi:hypothetical protein